MQTEYPYIWVQIENKEFRRFSFILENASHKTFVGSPHKYKSPYTRSSILHTGHSYHVPYAHTLCNSEPYKYMALLSGLDWAN